MHYQGRAAYPCVGGPQRYNRVVLHTFLITFRQGWALAGLALSGSSLTVFVVGRQCSGRPGLRRPPSAGAALLIPQAGQPTLGLDREASAEILSQTVCGRAGFAPMQRCDRIYAFESPGGCHRAFTVAGQFESSCETLGRRFDHCGQLPDRWQRNCGGGATGGRASPEHEPGGHRSRRDAEMNAVSTRLAWSWHGQIDPGFKVTPRYVRGGRRGRALDAFEQYSAASPSRSARATAPFESICSA